VLARRDLARALHGRARPADDERATKIERDTSRDAQRLGMAAA